MHSNVDCMPKISMGKHVNSEEYSDPLCDTPQVHVVYPTELGCTYIRVLLTCGIRKKVLLYLWSTIGNLDCEGSSFESFRQFYLSPNQDHLIAPIE